MSSVRANDLAIRLEQGAVALAALARGLNDLEWGTRMPHDGRTFGVIVHHVASQYVLEMQVATQVAGGAPIEGITSETIDQFNAKHAADFAGASKEAALDLLRRNSAAAAAAIRGLTDKQLDRAVPMSLYGDAPLTLQFFLEDHPVRHSYHHLARIRRAMLQPALSA
jgi:hypothetical protein